MVRRPKDHVKGSEAMLLTAQLSPMAMQIPFTEARGHQSTLMPICPGWEVPALEEEAELLDSSMVGILLVKWFGWAVEHRN